MIIFLLASEFCLALGDEWVKKADMPTARVGLSVCEVNGKIYAIGGLTPNGFSSIVEEYDPTLNIWTIKANMSFARAGLTTTTVNGKIYAIGGFNSTILEEYDPISDSWETKAPMPSPKMYHSAVVINDKIYVFGGYADFNNGTFSPLILVYDPNLDQWSKLKDIPQKFLMVCSSAVAFNDEVYFLGGHVITSFNLLTNILEYNTKNETWNEMNSTVVARVLGVAGIINDKVYFIGGVSTLFGDSKGMSNVEEYDVKTDTISNKLEIPHRRGWISGCVLGNSIYVLGGTTDWPGNIPNDYLSINEVYVSDVNISVNPQDKIASTWGSIKSIR